jgi:hypothetical protein
MINSSVYSLQVDTYTKMILDSLEPHPDIMEVEISPEAKWRPAGSSGPFLDVGQPFDRMLYRTSANCSEDTKKEGSSAHAASSNKRLSDCVTVKMEAGCASHL